MALNIVSVKTDFSSSARATTVSIAADASEKVAADDEIDQRTVGTEKKSGVFVALSNIGLQQAEQVKKHQDIDDSHLPDQVKTVLKMIRQLKAALLESTQALQQVMSHRALSETERMTKAQALQAEVSSLHSALAAAMGSLLKAIKDAGLSQEQSAEMIKLMN